MAGNASAARVLKEKLPSMKGVGLVNVRSYVLTHHGAEQWNLVLAALGPEDRESASGALAVGWYDVGVFARLLHAVDSVCGRGDLRLMDAVGAYEAEQDFNRVLRVFLRVLSPSQIFKAEARLWKHFQDSGDWNTVKVEGGMDAALSGWSVDEALCAELAGYLAKLVEYTGGKNVKVRHSECRARGAERCVFQYRWQ